MRKTSLHCLAIKRLIIYTRQFTTVVLS